MRVGQRLFLSVVPAVLGVFLVAALGYWGQYAHEVPVWFLVIAAVASAASLIIAWLNTRYVAQRIERLAGPHASAGRGESAGGVGALKRAAAVVGGVVPVRTSGAGRADELDTIETVVDRLSSAVSVARATEEAQAESLEQQRREYVGLISTATDEAMRQLEQVRLPLHILLENRFGDLNDNQEEMLGAARTAAEGADKELVRLREITKLDLGSLAMRHDRIRLADVIAAVLPALEIEGEPRRVKVRADVSPGLPAITGDRSRLQEAFSTLLRDALKRVPDGGDLLVSAEPEGGTGGAGGVGALLVTYQGDRGEPNTGDLALAQRLLRAHHCSLDTRDGKTIIHIPTRP